MTVKELKEFIEHNGFTDEDEIMISTRCHFSTSVEVEVGEYKGKNYVNLVDEDL